MTTLLDRPVKRESYGAIYSQGKSRAVIVSIEPPNVLGFRLKGTRRTFYLTTDGCYWQAVKACLAAEKREKKKQNRTVQRGRV